MAYWLDNCPAGPQEVFCCGADVFQGFGVHLMPRKWEKRYLRLGPAHGEEIFLIEGAGIAGVWTCIRPNQTITTVKITSKQGCTTAKQGGVAYRPSPTLSAAVKTVVEQRSAALKAEGVTGPAILGWVQERGTTRWKRALWIAFSMPALAVTGVCWLSGAWYRPLFFLGVLVVMYKVASWCGLTTFMSSVAGQATAFAHAMHDFFSEASATYATMQEYLHEFNERFGFEFTVLEVALMIVMAWVCIFVTILHWDDIDHELQRVWGSIPSESSSATSSASTSLDGTPPEPTVSGVAGAAPLDLARLTESLDSLARSQAALSHQVEELAVDQRAERARRAAEGFAGQLHGSPRPVPPYSQGDMDLLKDQVAAVRRMVEEDRAAKANGPRPVGHSSHTATTGEPTSGVHFFPGSSGGAASSPEVKGGGPNPDDKDIKDLIQRCERAGRSTADIWARVLKEFRKIPPDEWGMPADFKERLAPEVLSTIYVGNARFADMAKKFLTEHGLEECLYARALRDAAEAIDAAVLDDAVPGVINQVFLELLVRQAYAVMIGFQQCRQKSDWLKPKTNQGNWKSKVDFDIILRINPRAGDPRRELVRGAELEVRASMQRDALWAKARSDQAGAQVDFLNAG